MTGKPDLTAKTEVTPEIREKYEIPEGQNEIIDPMRKVVMAYSPEFSLVPNLRQIPFYYPVMEMNKLAPKFIRFEALPNIQQV